MIRQAPSLGLPPDVDQMSTPQRPTGLSVATRGDARVITWCLYFFVRALVRENPNTL